MPAQPAATGPSRTDEAEPHAVPSPQRLERLDAALREMMKTCPVPDHLRDLVEKLEAEDKTTSPDKAD